MSQKGNAFLRLQMRSMAKAKAGYILSFLSALSVWTKTDFLGVRDVHLQDQLFPKELEKSKRVIAVIVPEVAEVGGGVLSLFSIARELRAQQKLHGFEIMLLTRPQQKLVRRTYFKHKGFKNSECVFRFEQLLRCENIEQLILLVPEYATANFTRDLSEIEKDFLRGIKRLRLHILNQNIELMPDAVGLDGLRKLATNLTQSVGFHVNATQEVADQFELPTLLLPAYTDLSGYVPKDFNSKDKLIIYSPDDAPHKEACLSRIRKSFPQYKLREIRNIAFENYMELARNCKFSITFGEGFDGYFSQPMQMGGVSFAVYKPEFFPSKQVVGRYNIFSSPKDMADNIVERMNVLNSDRQRYEQLSKQWLDDINELYNVADYRRRIGRLAAGNFDFYPSKT